MKDLTYSINLNQQAKILELANQQDYEIFTIENTLLDDILIFNEKIRFGNSKPRKYIIIETQYLNEYSSELVMTLTNDDMKVNEFIERYNQIELEKELLTL